MASASASGNKSSSNNMDEKSRIECPMCFEVFKTPKCLLCGHSVCDQCCQGLLRRRSIDCPVCRKRTVVPAGGLPTCFALQDLIEYHENIKDQKCYQCVQCNRFYSAEETFLSKKNLNDELVPRCFRCIISIQSNSREPIPMESMVDTLKGYESDLSKLKRQMQLASTGQDDWMNSIHQALQMIEGNAEHIVQTSRSLSKTTLADMDHLNGEFQDFNNQTNSVKVPRSLNDLKNFKKSMSDSKSKLDKFIGGRKEMTKKMNMILELVWNGIDSLLNMVGNGNDNGFDQAAGVDEEEEEFDRGRKKRRLEQSSENEAATTSTSQDVPKADKQRRPL